MQCQERFAHASEDSVAEYMFVFLMLLVLKNTQTSVIMARFKNAPRKPTVRMFPANMLATAVTKTTEGYPDDHLFFGARCYTDAQRRAHKILPVCEF